MSGGQAQARTEPRKEIAMKLHHALLSSCSRRVTITARILGIELEDHRVDLRVPADRAAIRALNPMGKVPVLEDGDLVLWESHAIMQYLCALTPDQTLYPAAPRARAEVDRWLSWTSGHLAPAVGGLAFERLWKKALTGADADPGQVDRHETTLHPLGAVLDAHLDGRTWLAGDALTLADVSVACTLMHARPARLPIDRYARVEAHRARVAELDAWRRTEPPLLR
jgi:glutathione S-transferase